MYNFISFLPETYFFLSVLLLFLFCLIYFLSSILCYPNMSNTSIYLSCIILLYTFFLFSNNFTCEYTMLYKTTSNIIISEFLIVITIIILIVTRTYNKYAYINSFEYIIFILISLGSLIIFLNAINLILIYILLELQSITISILVSKQRYNRYSIESGIKYFILGSFSSLVLLFGISIIYGISGMINISDLAVFFDYLELINNKGVLYSMKFSSIFVLIGILFKIYSAPFHLWLPDIYEGSPTSVVIYLSTVQLIVMISFFLKIYYYLLFDIIATKQLILIVVSILTLLFGSYGALAQNQIKKLISFSTVTMSGFFLFSIVNNNYILLESFIMYLLVYLITILLLFILLLNMFTYKSVISSMSDLFNIYNNNIILSSIFTILIFSISGIPPFIGFISKLFWLKSLLLEYVIFIFILLIAFLIVTYYYIKLIKNIYFIHDSNNNFSFLSQIKYEVCVAFLYIMLFLLYSIFNSSIISGVSRIFVLDLINLI